MASNNNPVHVLCSVSAASSIPPHHKPRRTVSLRARSLARCHAVIHNARPVSSAARPVNHWHYTIIRTFGAAAYTATTSHATCVMCKISCPRQRQQQVSEYTYSAVSMATSHVKHCVAANNPSTGWGGDIGTGIARHVMRNITRVFYIKVFG